MNGTTAEAGGRSSRPSGPIVAAGILLLFLLAGAAIKLFPPTGWFGGNTGQTAEPQKQPEIPSYVSPNEPPSTSAQRPSVVEPRSATHRGSLSPANTQREWEGKRLLDLSRQTFHAFYSDQSLADPDRAQLIDFVANVVPVERWKTEEVRSGETPESLIQRVYNLSGETNRKSVDVLEKTIRYVGTDTGISISAFPQGVKTVKVPPIPIKTSGSKPDRESNVIRLQDFESEAVRAVNDVRDLGFIPADKLPKDEVPSEGDATVLLLGTYEDLINTMRRNGRWVSPPDNVRIMRNDGNVDMVLKQGGGNSTSECSEAKDWIKNNLRGEGFVRKLEDLHKNKDQEGVVKQRAMVRNLVIMDWVEAPLNHGKKVESVVHYVLDELLHLPDLKQYVTELDLNPADPRNRPRLLELLDSYHQAYCYESPGLCATSKEKSVVDALFVDAADWVRKGGEVREKENAKNDLVRFSASEGVFPVRQFVFEAAVWRYLKPQSHAWVNMSFAVRSLDSAVTSVRKMSTTNGLVFAAADDDHVAEGITFPQLLATDLPQFVNVSYGTSDGRLLGGFTSTPPPAPRIVVSLVGPGCGYSYESISNNDLGSSYATPYIAAFAWVESLLEDIPPERMREDLVSASAMVPQELTIESAGLFDPSLLFAADSSWYGYSGGNPTQIVDGKMRLEYRRGNDVDVLNCSPARPCSVLFFQEDGNAFVRMRWRESGDSYVKSLVGNVVKIECNFTDSNHDPIPLCRGNEMEFPKWLRLVIRGDSGNLKAQKETSQHDHN